MQNVSVRKNHASYFKYDCEKLIGPVNGVIDDNRFYIGKCLRMVLALMKNAELGYGQNADF